MSSNNVLFKEIDLNCLKSIIDNACIKKHTFNNYYGIDLSNVQCYGDEENLFLVKEFEGYRRVYVMANDKDLVKVVFSSLPFNSCVNIPSKKGIDAWLPLLNESGYKQIATYQRYGYINYRKGNDRNLMFAEKEDLMVIEKELHYFFSPLTGHLPNTDELSKMIEEKQIVVNRDSEGHLNGALCYQVKGKKAELPFWFDRAGDGLSLLFNVFYLCHQVEVRQIVFWVNDVNTNTIAIHKMLGAKEDGLIDYIFNKQ